MADTSPPEGTRLALLEAGLHLFGQHGFAATSTREIAARAQTNIASIAYHFGGKDGLRLACAQEFARRVGAVLATVPTIPPSDAAMAHTQLRAILGGVTAFLIGRPEAEILVAFMLRELAENGPGLDHIYSSTFEPTHRRVCVLWGVATGQNPESEAVRLRVFTLIGQIVYFRIGAPLVTRRMQWTSHGPAEVAATTSILLANLDALLGATGKDIP